MVSKKSRRKQKIGEKSWDYKICHVREELYFPSNELDYFTFLRKNCSHSHGLWE